MIFENFFDNEIWNMEVEPFQVSRHIYYVGTAYVGCYLIESSEGLILLDQGFSETVFMTFESIRKLGFDPKAIKHLLISHGHVDHCGGTRLIKEYTGAKVYMSKIDYDMMKEHPEWVSLGNVNFLDFDVDEFFSDDRLLCFGDITIRTKLTAGHTPGTTSFFIEDYDNSGRKYIAAMHGGLGFNTMREAFFEKYPAWPRDLSVKYKRAMEALIGEKVDIPLPSHPPQVPIMDKAGAYKDGEANPFICRDGFEKLVRERLEMVKQFLP